MGYRYYLLEGSRRMLHAAEAITITQNNSSRVSHFAHHAFGKTLESFISTGETQTVCDRPYHRVCTNRYFTESREWKSWINFDFFPSVVSTNFSCKEIVSQRMKGGKVVRSPQHALLVSVLASMMFLFSLHKDDCPIILNYVCYPLHCC